MLDATGEVAVHTGEQYIPAAGHLTGEGVSAQANCVERPAVWESMVAAFEGASGTMARRLLAALQAAEAAGGDWRGRQAAGIRVVPAAGQRWETVYDLRVDDHPEPLAELERLIRLHEGYTAIGEIDDSAAVARAQGWRSSTSASPSSSTPPARTRSNVDASSSPGCWRRTSAGSTTSTRCGTPTSCRTPRAARAS